MIELASLRNSQDLRIRLAFLFLDGAKRLEISVLRNVPSSYREMDGKPQCDWTGRRESDEAHLFNYQC
jgi:hypothetical protein